MQFVYENPQVIVALFIIFEMLKGDGRHMGDQIRDTIMNDPLQKILLAMATASLFWTGQNGYNNSLKLAAVEQKIEALATDRFTSAQAALLAQRLDRLERVVEGQSSR